MPQSRTDIHEPRGKLVKIGQRGAVGARASQENVVSVGSWSRDGFGGVEAGVFSRALWRMLVISTLQLTAFAPDEYFQGPEVAHRIVFGYGHVTWEWVAGLRSYLHPMLYVALYKAASVCLPTQLVRLVTWWGPYVLHAVISAWTVLGAYRLAQVVFKPDRSSFQSICALNASLVISNWFIGYCMTRPYSNSLEAAFCTHGLVAYVKSVFPRAGRTPSVETNTHIWKDTIIWMMFGALCVVLRPASGLFWAMLAARALIWPRPETSSIKCRLEVLGVGIAVSVAVLALTTWLDIVMYGRIEVVPWNFLRFNVLEGGSALYGVSPWHANLTMHLPSMLLTAFPAFWYGWYASWSLRGRVDRTPKGLSGEHGERSRVQRNDGNGAVAERVGFLAWCAFFYCMVYSIPAHKEVRFLLPIVPMCLPVVSYGMNVLATGRRWSIAAFLRLYTWIHGLALVYFSLFHQRGQVRVMSVIRSLHASGSMGGLERNGTTSVLFLTPCHFTPYYASIHDRNVRMRFFDCSPEAYRSGVHALNADERGWLQLPDLPDGVSERSYFESNADKVVEDALRLGKPDVVVSLEAHEALQKHNYTLYWQHWNPMDSVQVYRRGGSWSD